MVHIEQKLTNVSLCIYSDGGWASSLVGEDGKAGGWLKAGGLTPLTKYAYHQGVVVEFSKGVQRWGHKFFKNYMGVANRGGTEFFIWGLDCFETAIVDLRHSFRTN